MKRVGSILAISWLASGAVLLDRVAIVVNNRVIKDSDVNRDLRVTQFQNRVPLDTGPAARKEAAGRLIDQMLIRREFELSQYHEASPADAEKLLAHLRQQAGGTAGYSAALTRYGITEDEVRRQLAWQMTVLNFIEQRFRPGVLIADEDVQKYFDQHAAEFRARAGGKPVVLSDVSGEIENLLAEERVNRDFFAWLEQARKQANIRYVEADLK